MERVVLIKYGELTTKKGNRNFFVNTLKKNVLYHLRDYNIKLVNDNSRMYIYFEEKDIEAIIEIINKIFGVHMYHIAYICDTNIDSIYETCLNAIKENNFKTFKVETKRSDKTFEYDSITFSKMLGGHILKNISNIAVDVHVPELLIRVEIRNNKTYIYLNS